MIKNQHQGLIINEDYKKFILGESKKESKFLPVTQDKLTAINDNTELAQQIGLFMKSREKEDCIYGIEIKLSGSSRSKRLPLVKKCGNSIKIFKIINSIKDIDHAVNVFEDINYFIKKEKLPSANNVIVVRNLSENDKKSEYFKNVILDNNIEIIGLKDLLS